MLHTEIKGHTHLLTKRDETFQVVQNTTSHLCDYTPCYYSDIEQFLLSTQKFLDMSFKIMDMSFSLFSLMNFAIHYFFNTLTHSTKDIGLILPFTNKANPEDILKVFSTYISSLKTAIYNKGISHLPLIL